MKKLILLLLFIPLLSFGQDVLYLKSSELKKGVFIEKLDNDIVFQIEGESKYTRFSIDLVEIIETNNRANFYPFDIPISSTYKNPKNIPRKLLGYGDKFFWCYCVIVPLLIYLELTGHSIVI